MNAPWVCLILFLLPLVFPPLAAARSLHGRVVKVFDGDTFLIRVHGREEYVRLREIDAPEISHSRQRGQEPFGKRAREFARSRVGGKTVRLEVEEGEERDQYHRLLAYVFVGDALINQEMIQSGNAFFYPGPFLGKHASQLEKAEEWAREKGIGVWDQKNGLKERPREFRRRTKREEGFLPVPPDKDTGDRRSMFYNLPGSTSPQNRVRFDLPSLFSA
jgi:endonuclease YncB( thermonuclease family)